MLSLSLEQCWVALRNLFHNIISVEWIFSSTKKIQLSGRRTVCSVQTFRVVEQLKGRPLMEREVSSSISVLYFELRNKKELPSWDKLENQGTGSICNLHMHETHLDGKNICSLPLGVISSTVRDYDRKIFQPRALYKRGVKSLK